MHSIHNFFRLFTAPSQSGEPLGVQALVGLIALGIFVWGARGLTQWKAIDTRKKFRYILLAALSSVVFFVSLREIYYGVAMAKSRDTSGLYSYSVLCSTNTSVYDNTVTECSTYTK